MPVTELDAVAFTADSDPSGSPTISAGANRAAVVFMPAEPHDINYAVTAFTMGGQAPTASYEFFTADGVDDMFVGLWLWNEAAITAMSGTSISFTDNQTLDRRGWGIHTFTGVDQTTFPKGQDDNADTGSGTSLAATTTSNSGDRILCAAMAKSSGVTFTSWDTLTEEIDQAVGPNQMRAGYASGDGGDATTTVTVSSGVSWALNAVVLQQASTIIPNAMYHYNRLRNPF